MRMKGRVAFRKTLFFTDVIKVCLFSRFAWIFLPGTQGSYRDSPIDKIPPAFFSQTVRQSDSQMFRETGEETRYQS